MAPSSKFAIALIQMLVRTNKQENLKHASELVAEAMKRKPSLVALPECFNCPYGVKHFPEYAESIPGETTTLLSELAKKHNIFLIGGTIPERDGTKLYNTCTVFGPDGSMVAKYRKLHLFDIDIPNKITFKESDALSPGSKFVTFQTPFCKIGLGICYDMRFPEVAQIYRKSGCNLIVYPGAFNMTTGPAHWELLQRARAVDNQLCVAAVSVARDESASYIAWGHSSIVNAWGEVCGKLDENEGILYNEIDINQLNDVRQQIPVSFQRRNDLYKVESLVEVE